jgi:DNA mismatch repair protein MutL
VLKILKFYPGDREFFIDSLPGILSHFDAKNLVEKILNDFKTRPVDIKEEIKEHLAEILARASAINHGTSLKTEEIGELFDNLFACQTPNFSPSGKNIITIMETEEFEKLLK